MFTFDLNNKFQLLTDQNGRVHSPIEEVGDRVPLHGAGLAETASNVSGGEEQAEQVALRNTAAEDATEKAEQSEEVFECNICDFVSNWDSGLQVHMTRKHRNIEQIDGNALENEEFESLRCRNGKLLENRKIIGKQEILERYFRHSLMLTLLSRKVTFQKKQKQLKLRRF